jgi:hypothetical protein
MTAKIERLLVDRPNLRAIRNPIRPDLLSSAIIRKAKKTSKHGALNNNRSGL